MQARDIMTSPVITVPETASLPEALRLMVDHHLSGLPVTDRFGRLVGMLTEGDLLRRAEVGTGARHHSLVARILFGPGEQACDYVRANSRCVTDLMTSTPVYETENTSLEDIVQLMEERRIKRVPILQDDKVVGLVTRHDIIRAVASRLAPAPADDSKDAILARLTAELDSQPWFKNRRIGMQVDNGIVHLEGIIDDPSMLRALVVAAQNASGREEVDTDMVVLVDPLTASAFPLA